MAKVALLIGVSEYESGLNPLPSAVKDVDAMQQVLVNPDIGGFPPDNVSLLKNPNRQTMAEAVEQLFAGRRKDDLLVLFFSGHGKKDDTGRLYLASRNTRNTPEGDLIRASALPASFIHESMERSRSRRQVVILDSCFSGAFAEGLAAKDDGSINIREQLGGEGRAVLTSSSSTQYSFEQKGAELSIYTRFLIEGITTGEADLDEDEVISIDELHEYASNKVREFQPAMKPEIYAIREGFKIQLTKVPLGNPHEKYQKVVKRYGKRGKLSIVSQSILEAWRNKLALSVDEAEALKEEVLEPYRREFQQKIQRYEQAFTKVLQEQETVDDATRQELQELQKTLELRNEDTVPIEAKVIGKIEAYQQNLQSYEEAFNEELRQDYPLSEAKRNQMRQLAQQMELTEVDIASIETRITAEVEKYHHNLAQYQQIFAAAVRQEYPISNTKRSELKSQQQNLGLTEVDIASVEAQITTEIETYQQKLQQYEQAFVDATEGKHYPSESTRKQLRQTWQTLELSEVDVAEIEARINTQIESYQTNLRQYEQEFAEAIEQQYPLSEAKQLELRQRQQALTIAEEDVASIEIRLKTELELHLNKLQQYEQALTSAMEYEQPLTDETREDLRQLQKVLELDNEDVALIEAKIAKVQQQEEEYQNQNKLQQYEQEFLKAVEQEYPLSKHAREQINIWQQCLGLRNEDIRQIEQPILATKYQEKHKKEEEERLWQKQLENISSHTPPRQERVILSHKKARPSKAQRHRRIIFLTVLGSLIIFLGFETHNSFLLFVGVFLLLVMFISSSMHWEDTLYHGGRWITDEEIALWRQVVFWLGAPLGAVFMIIMGASGLWDTWGETYYKDFEVEIFVSSLIFYLISIYIGRW